MEKLSRRLFFRVLPGVAAALGLAAKAKPVVVDEPVAPRRIYEQYVAGQLEHLFEATYPKIGRTINVRRPQRFIGREGAKFLAELNLGEMQNLQFNPDPELGRTVSIIDPDGTRRQIPLNGGL